jgi:hypothetical protein
VEAGSQRGAGSRAALDAGRPLDRPKPGRLPADQARAAAIVTAHAEALARGDSGYEDPGTGLFVMTAAHLASRGFCCANGCRHCPYM